jgi:hypothetical protein
MRTLFNLYSAFALLFAAVVAWSIMAIPRAEDIDSGSYRLMARGEPACRPYANRILHPALAGLLGYGAAKTGGQEENGNQPSASRFSFADSQFLIIAVLSSIVFYLCILSLLRDVRPRWWVFILLVSPLWWVWGGNIYIQDMFAAALTALMFILLRALDSPGGRSSSAIFLLLTATVFLMQLTRESSAVIALSLVALAAIRRDWRLSLGVLVATALGMSVVAWASRNALPNTNELGGAAYLVCKTLANGLRNFTGIIPWNDGYAANLPWQYPDPPIWKCALPAFLQAGNVHEVGIYAFAPKLIVRTLAAWLLYFPGALLFAFAAWRRGGITQTAWKGHGLHVQLAFAAGALFWLLAPFSGASMERLAGYAWPLFWIALPTSARCACPGGRAS